MKKLLLALTVLMLFMLVGCDNATTTATTETTTAEITTTENEMLIKMQEELELLKKENETLKMQNELLSNAQSFSMQSEHFIITAIYNDDILLSYFLQEGILETKNYSNVNDPYRFDKHGEARAWIVEDLYNILLIYEEKYYSSKLNFPELETSSGQE